MAEPETLRGEFFETVVERPPKGWKLGYFTLSLRNPDEHKVIEAWRHGAFAVHQVRSGGRLSHAPTGLGIWTFDTLDLAAECAERIEPLAAWEDFDKPIPSG